MATQKPAKSKSSQATHKPFRELVNPGSNFEFVGRSRRWTMLSLLLIAGSIAMLFVNKQVRGDYLNWTIDFKGGTELIFEFCEAGSDEHVDTVAAGDVRSALKSAGYDGFNVSGFSWEGADKCLKDDRTKREDEHAANTHTVRGMLVRTSAFGALDKSQQDEIALALRQQVSASCIAGGKTEEQCAVSQSSWSGDRLFVRSKFSLDEAAIRAFFTERELEVKPGSAGYRVEVEEGIDEINTEITIFGIGRQFSVAITKALDGSRAHLIQAYGVGAKAGAQLRNDGIKSLFYAILLIVLYLAFRFDIRYAPGAVLALMHDAILVMGVFAVTWTDVSLTSVAALLTVIGYSVNDTVVIFDRVRENIGRLKDKKLTRIVNISLNETMGRTLLTSLTLFAVTSMMFIFGTGLVKNFAFAMNIGVIVGTYSSIFIASPIFLWIDGKFYPAKTATKKRSGSKAKKTGSKNSKDSAGASK